MKNNAVKISFNDIFSYRSVWMFLAIFWVVFFHSSVDAPIILAQVKALGYAGVDIFLFASGIGCFFSLKKNPDITAFLKRRLISILPMWLVFLPMFFIYKHLVSGIGIHQMVGNIFGFGYFAGLENQFNWYIAAMWVCYLLAPIFTDIVSRAKTAGKLLVLLVLCVISFLFFNHSQLMLWSRLPIFYIGIMAAELSTRKSGLSLKEIILTIAVMLVGAAALALAILYCPDMLKPYGLWWYPFILITPGLVLLISMVSHFLSKTRLNVIVNVLNKCGHYTFSLYLGHIFVFEIFGNLQSKGVLSYGSAAAFIAILLSIAFAIALNYITVFVRYLWRLIFAKADNCSVS